MRHVWRRPGAREILELFRHGSARLRRPIDRSQCSVAETASGATTSWVRVQVHHVRLSKNGGEWSVMDNG